MRRDSTGSSIGVRTRAIAVVVVAFAAVMCIAALQGLPTFGTLLGPESDFPQEQSTMPAQDTAPPTAPEPNPWWGMIAAIIGGAIALVFAIFLIRILVTVFRDLWRDRPLGRVSGAVPDTDAVAATAQDEAVAEPAVRQGIASALDAVDAHADPGDAIIAAWVGLEGSAERAGHHRGAAETASEFTVRIVAGRSESAADIRALLRLYERVRFGGVHADERSRTEARALLTSIERHWR